MIISLFFKPFIFLQFANVVGERYPDQILSVWEDLLCVQQYLCTESRKSEMTSKFLSLRELVNKLVEVWLNCFKILDNALRFSRTIHSLMSRIKTKTHAFLEIFFYSALKGLSHEMDLAFDAWLVLGLNRGRGHFF
jgi:hypothetical protein